MSLVTRIKNEIGSRLERSEDLQIPLTVQGLSEHYGVSYTPVRRSNWGINRGRIDPQKKQRPTGSDSSQ